MSKLNDKGKFRLGSLAVRAFGASLPWPDLRGAAHGQLARDGPHLGSSARNGHLGVPFRRGARPTVWGDGVEAAASENIEISPLSRKSKSRRNFVENSIESGLPVFTDLT